MRLLATSEIIASICYLCTATTSQTYGKCTIFLQSYWNTLHEKRWISHSNILQPHCHIFIHSVDSLPTAILCEKFNATCRFGSGTGQIWLDDVNCVGTESRLISCSNRGVGSHNCVHSEDVAVYCSPRKPLSTVATMQALTFWYCSLWHK